jgi:hypothetical protein
LPAVPASARGAGSSSVPSPGIDTPAGQKPLVSSGIPRAVCASATVCET